MLRISAQRLANRRRNLILACSTGAIGLTGGAAYVYAAHSEDVPSLVGLQRQATFWYRVVPVVLDYFWKFSSRSPLVKYQRWSAGGANNNIASNAGNSSSNETATVDANETTIMSQQQDSLRRQKQLQACHEQHAPEILQVMLDLKGLFVKLGQVLSVSALPLPEPYRLAFKTLQDQVPGHEDYATIMAILEQEFGKETLHEIFESVEETPAGAASIGQAHRAILKKTGEQVIVKIQYPDAAWQVPADIESVGNFMKLCVWAGVLDQDAAQMSFQEFSRQFINELDYESERNNLQTIYESSLDKSAPYLKRNIVVPRVLKDYCTPRVITMTYLPGSKLEDEARRQLAMLGIDTSKQSMSAVVRDSARDATAEAYDSKRDVELNVVKEDASLVTSSRRSSVMAAVSQLIGRTIGIDAVLYSIRLARRVVLWSTAVAVSAIQSAAPVLPGTLLQWATEHQTAALQAERLSLTATWIDGLFDVHGHQIFAVGLFNGDPHPGNILVLDKDYVDEGTSNTRQKPFRRQQQQQQLGLIDFGQCKRLSSDEQVRIAHLILSVANHESDESIADALRALKIQTKNDSTLFLATFARLMFSHLQPEHMDHGWHRKLHELDKVTYFPNELSMVYRTSLLLRGLALSLQVNPSVAQQWKHHAEKVVKGQKF
ncbi:hypothetical protein MPSEU_000337300 [Mayamaea pseudoterrestris]|nr:hypothetical protein MPSEU_000337300 [Mayamaea pseudoterrestris]